MATKIPVVGFTVTEFQLPKGKVVAVHVIASVDDAPTVEPPLTIAAKTPVFGLTVTPLHGWGEGNVRVVHVIPSIDEELVDEKNWTAKNRL
jgi:hypothetical protein